MTPEQLGERSETLIIKGSESFYEGVSASQKNAYKKIAALIKELDVDSRGRIKRTVKNMARINRINKDINNVVLTDSYKAKVSKYLALFPAMDTLQKQYFGSVFKDAFDPEKFLFTELREQATERATTLLLDAGISANFTEPIKNILKQNMLSGAQFSDLNEELRQFILSDGEGQLLRYTKQVTSDSLHVYAGTYQQIVGEELGLEWVKYTGGTRDSTRPFCNQRSGKFFHKSEVQDWASLDWAGKMKGTTSSTIFQNAGGYNCRHIITFVSKALVPESVRKRKNSE